MSLAIVVTETR